MRISSTQWAIVMALLAGSCLFDWDGYDPRLFSPSGGFGGGPGGATAGGFGGGGQQSGGQTSGGFGGAGGSGVSGSSGGGSSGGGGGGTSAACGDGILQPPEQCDDGNGDADDGCDEDCLVECDGGMFRAATSHCYRLSQDTGTWQQARSGCLGLGPGYDLAAISSEQELDWLLLQPPVAALFPGDDVYIGGTDAQQEGSWEWTNGEAWAFEGWNPAQPDNWNNEDYLELEYSYLSSEVGFNDLSGTTIKQYLCELTPAGSNP